MYYSLPNLIINFAIEMFLLSWYYTEKNVILLNYFSLLNYNLLNF